MYKLLGLALLVACATICDGREISTKSTTTDCKPGESFIHEDGCNACKCNAEGTAASCTLKLCVPLPKPKRSAHHEHKESEHSVHHDHGEHHHAEQHDQPHEQKHEHHEQKHEQKHEHQHEQKHEHDHQHDKHEQHEHKEHHKIEKRNSTGSHNHTKRETRRKCTPGVSVPSEDGCNTCFCSPEGYVAGCTLKACVNIPPQQQQKGGYHRSKRTTPRRCTPGKSVPAGDGCNTCICTAKGTVGGCTLKGCLNSRSRRATEEKCTTPGKRVPAGDGCNTCLCMVDGSLGVCTLKACESHHRQ